MKPLPKSLWAATATPPTSYPPLSSEVTADCVAVGGGFTGLSTALHLAERGIRVVLLEANEPGWGASGRNGGQIIPGLKLDPSELRAKYGDERGRRLTKTVGATADLVFDLIQRHGIDCDATRSGWIQGASGPKGLAAVRNRAEEWRNEGADVAVLDADQVPALIAPILRGEADLVIGDRGVGEVAHFSWTKRRLQEVGSWVVRKVSNTEVPDTTSGFRALTREAALRLNIVSEFTYTLESIIQAGKKRLAIANVPIQSKETRPSRLFASTFEYLKRSGATIVRIYAMYEPLKLFTILGGVLLAGGFGLGLTGF